MQQQIIETKKKKRKNLLYLSNVNDITEDLEEKILDAFHGHVGEDNRITPYELFVKVYRVDPDTLDIYQRTFFWNIINKALHFFRKRGRLYVINKGSHLFVLKTIKESNEFKHRLDATIIALEKTKVNADVWVRNQRYKEFEE